MDVFRAYFESGESKLKQKSNMSIAGSSLIGTADTPNILAEIQKYGDKKIKKISSLLEVCTQSRIAKTGEKSKKNGKIFLVQTFYRFTKIRQLKEILEEHKLYLSNAEYWDDSVDQAFLKTYSKNENGGNPVYALCLCAKRSALMWKIYAAEKDSIRLDLNSRIIKKLCDAQGMQLSPILYESALNSKDMKIALQKHTELYPFIKRVPFRDEYEWRIISKTRKYLDLTKINPSELLISVTLSPAYWNKLMQSKQKIENELKQLISKFQLKATDDLTFNNNRLIKSYCENSKKEHAND